MWLLNQFLAKFRSMGIWIDTVQIIQLDRYSSNYSVYFYWIMSAIITIMLAMYWVCFHGTSCIRLLESLGTAVKINNDQRLSSEHNSLVTAILSRMKWRKKFSRKQDVWGREKGVGRRLVGQKIQEEGWT